ncbi:hypothetical protein D3C83_163580 [compost metagenome]
MHLLLCAKYARVLWIQRRAGLRIEDHGEKECAAITGKISDASGMAGRADIGFG